MVGVRADGTAYCTTGGGDPVQVVQLPKPLTVDVPVSNDSPICTPIAFKPFIPEEVDPWPKSKRKRSIAKLAKIIRVLDLDVDTHIRVHPVAIFGKKHIKMVKISPPSATNPRTRIPVRVQFNGGGRLPFGVKTDKWLKHHINFSVADTDEAKRMMQFNEELVQLAIKNKAVWWPKRHKDIDEKTIRQNFLPPMFPAEEKQDKAGEFWDPNCRVKVPITLTTGEPAAVRRTARQKVCEIIDSDGAIVSVHDLTGRKWKKIIVDIGGIYFNGKFGWGLGPYTLSKVLLDHDYEAEADYEEVDFLTDEEGMIDDGPAPYEGINVVHKSKRQKQRDARGEVDEDDCLSQKTTFPATLR